MSLNFTALLKELEGMGEHIAQQRQARERLLPIAHRSLARAASHDPDLLRAKIQAAGDRWPGAVPGVEAIDAPFEPGTLPPYHTVIGADGSQIYPDRHASALYYLINIGGIRISYGSDAPPSVYSRPSLAFTPEQLHLQGGGQVDNTIVNARRDVAELRELARLAADSVDGPSLALLDNGLLLWLLLQLGGQVYGEAEELLDQYLSELDRLQESGTALAGYVDRPASGNVLALLHLSQLALDRIDDAHLRDNPFQALTDRDLFGWLPTGCRSARFVNASPVNQEFKAAGHQMEFFYLNVGDPGGVVRVEVPGWVAERPQLLMFTHAAILAQCKSTPGFPYALARAHELAVVTQPERESLTQILNRELLQQGILPQPSTKSLTKRWIGSKRRHQI
jgi:hypothetical protein